ncbi:MAG: glycosyltransferase [Deltaproteobacteria bacterium]|nr:glycosyltransferase [Deltaproteobacteria bacterium]
MRIFYFFSAYISHLTAGLDYFRCLASLGHCLGSNLPSDVQADYLSAPSAGSLPDVSVKSPPKPLPETGLTREQLDFAATADLIILHDEPTRYPEIFQRLPFLSDRRVAAYVAWENETLSPFYAGPLQLVSEVWSCSDFSCRAIAPHVRKCRLLPHLVQRHKLKAEDLRWADEIFGRGADSPFVFLSVIDGINPRKNLRGLLTAYSLMRRNLRRPTRLLLKQYRASLDLTDLSASGLDGVSSLEGELSAGRMAALYAGCDAYVSAHHAEGWGLGLSSAMAYGKPVIATGYSGNMQYMHSGNSLPILYEFAPVSDEMLRLTPLFQPGMRWADPDLSAFASAMHMAAAGRLPADLPANAAKIVRDYGPKAITERLAELINS